MYLAYVVHLSLSRMVAPRSVMLFLHSSCAVTISTFIKVNGFEQLCINFANEKLQQMFNKHTFTLEEDTYKKEGVPFKHVEFHDSQPLLDFLGLPASGVSKDGVFPILDEQTMVREVVMQVTCVCCIGDVCVGACFFIGWKWNGRNLLEQGEVVTQNQDYIDE